MPKMHEHEVETNPMLVKRLLQSQFPQWADLPIKQVTSAGTDNALYRLGDELVVRLPRIDWAIAQIDKEYAWLPRFAPQLPLAISEPLAKGEPAEGYPWRWGVYRWLEGENLKLEQLANPVQAAEQLAHFLLALQQIDTADWPIAQSGSRGLPLSTRDAQTRQAIQQLADMFDPAAVTAIWETALEADEWQRPPVWYHGDILPGNLLFKNGRLHAVIDFGAMGIGDPACDLMIAWGLFAGESRETFRTTLGVDEATWLRGRGQALAQALIFIPYYLHTNPIGVANAQHAIKAILKDYLT